MDKLQNKPVTYEDLAKEYDDLLQYIAYSPDDNHVYSICFGICGEYHKENQILAAINHMVNGQAKNGKKLLDFGLIAKPMNYEEMLKYMQNFKIRLKEIYQTFVDDAKKETERLNNI